MNGLMQSMAQPQPPAVGLACSLTDCDEADPNCIYPCVYYLSGLGPGSEYYPLLPPPPPPPPPSAKYSQSRLAPFLIAAVCILGISFLLLTTCTIIFRCHFSRRRRTSSARIDDSPTDDSGSVVDHPIWHIATVGLQQSVIDSIAALKYKKLDGLLIDGTDCSVCLTEFEDGDDLRLLPKCSHAFHLPCIDTWLRSHKNCPLCRAPVVNDAPGATNFSFRQLGSSRLDPREDALMENSEFNGGGSVLPGVDGESSHQLSEGGDVLVDLPIEGVKLAQILKKNRELRILSDLGENHRFRCEEDGADPTRRSISFSCSATLEVDRPVGNVCSEGCEGSSSNTHLHVEEKKIHFDDKGSKRGSSTSGLLMKSSSIDRALQKGSVSMKRSFSSSSKFFSFRRTKSQASVLPL